MSDTTARLARFAAALRAIRHERGLSQRDLASIVSTYDDHFGRPLRCTYSYLARLELGERVPSLHMVEGLARALSVPREHLLDSAGDQSA